MKNNDRALLPLFLAVSLIFRESLLAYFTVGISVINISLLLFSVCFSLFFAFLLSLFKKSKVAFALALTVDVLLSLCFVTEALLYRSFGYFYNPETIADMGGDVAGSFGGHVAETVFGSLHIILPFFIPAILLIILRGKLFRFRSRNAVFASVCALSAVISHILGLTAVYYSDGTPLTPYEKYTASFDFNSSVRDFGLLTSLRLNTEYSLSGIPPKPESKRETNLTAESNLSLSKEYNISAVDFSVLKENVPEISGLCDRFSSVPPTEKNAYTGFFKGKNLIFICAEAFSPYAVSEEYTPTLYRLANSGFVFPEYYQPSFGESTSGGEYTLLLGQVPKRDSGESGLSMKITCPENLQYSLPGAFRRAGYITRGFHNNSFTYYQRNLTHPQMGMDWYGIGGSVCPLYGDSLDLSSMLSPGWPRSDAELAKAVLPVITGSDTPVFTYLLTCSGHNNYSFSENSMARKNADICKGSEMPEKIKAYLCCQYELESALSVLIEGLSAAGELDNTVIALSNDHYPYGLSASWQGNGGKSYIDALYGKTPENIRELEKGCFFIWSSEMETPVVTEKPVCGFDVLPTLLNLFGMDYDSRVLAGRDALSDTPGLAFFSDYSFVTEKSSYDAKTGAFTVNAPDDTESFETILSEVKNRILYSKMLRQKDFFRYFPGK